jgi:predicted ATPase/class 3 adenylate cyclase
MTATLPSGVVTFVFTDIEGSTPLFERLGDAYLPLQARHRELLRAAWAAHGGHEVSTEGDSFFVAFADPAAALRACADGQLALASEPWPGDASIRVRMGVHAGTAEPFDGNYTALAVHVAARVMAAGNGGQVVASEIVRDLAEGNVDATFVDDGPQRLRGLSEPLRLFRVQVAGVPVDERPLRTSRLTRTNIPGAAPELVGRTSELAELSELLMEERCITVTGSGGVGKTQLALAAAAAAAEHFEAGYWFVDLAPLRLDADVATTLARLLQVSPDAEPIGGAASAIGDDRVLVLLDNCEHVISGAADVAAVLLKSCPRLVVLATSREPLGLADERTWRLPSLSSDDSLELLRLRVKARGDHAHSQDDLEQLQVIATRLDGIPLALELAAARCATMAPADVAARLDERFRLLTRGRGLSRHQTLEAAVAWSFDLLDDTTRAVFRRLAAFAGGWTLELAEAVAGDESIDAFDVDDAMSALVDKSLVNVDFDQVPARYSFLETIRQFAQAELVRAGEAAQVQDRHAATMAELATLQASLILGPSESSAIDCLRGEQDNLQTAADWALSRGDVGAAATITHGALHGLLTLGAAPELALWVGRVLDAMDSDPAAVSIEDYANLAADATRVEDLGVPDDPTVRRLERALVTLEGVTAPSAIDARARCASALSVVRAYAGHVEDALRLRRLVNELTQDSPILLAQSLVQEGAMLVEFVGDEDGARRCIERGAEIARHAGSLRAHIDALKARSWIESRADNVAALLALAEETAQLVGGVADFEAADVLADLARQLIGVGEFDRGAELSARAVQLAARSGRAAAVLFVGVAAGEAAAALGDYDAAEREWLLTAELASRQRRVWASTISRFRLAVIYEEQGRHAERRRVLEEVRDDALRSGSMPAQSWYELDGRARLHEGDFVGAREALLTAVRLAFEGGHKWEIAFVVQTISVLAHDAGRFDDAVRLSALAYSLVPRQQLRSASSVMTARRAERTEGRSGAAFAADELAGLQAEGTAWTFADVERVVEALTEPGNS